MIDPVTWIVQSSNWRSFESEPCQDFSTFLQRPPNIYNFSHIWMIFHIFPGSSTILSRYEDPKILRGWQYGLVVAGGHGVDAGLHQAWRFSRIFPVTLRWFSVILWFHRIFLAEIQRRIWTSQKSWRSPFGRNSMLIFCNCSLWLLECRKVNRAQCLPTFETEFVSPCEKPLNIQTGSQLNQWQFFSL